MVFKRVRHPSVYTENNGAASGLSASENLAPNEFTKIQKIWKNKWMYHLFDTFYESKTSAPIILLINQ